MENSKYFYKVNTFVNTLVITADRVAFVNHKPSDAWSSDQQGAVTWQPVSREAWSAVNNSTVLVLSATDGDGTLKCKTMSFCINQLHLTEISQDLSEFTPLDSPLMPNCSATQSTWSTCMRRSFTLCVVRDVDRQLPAEGVHAHHAVGGWVSQCRDLVVVARNVVKRFSNVCGSFQNNLLWRRKTSDHYVHCAHLADGCTSVVPEAQVRLCLS